MHDFIDRRSALARLAGLAAGGMSLGHPLQAGAAARRPRPRISR